jgi:FtsP/CotA-like multicopper oxidase with cupredoxin domain
MKALATITLCLMVALPCAAQQPEPAAVPADGVAAADAPALPTAAPATGILNLAEWLSIRAGNLAMRERMYDPFGRPKDPSKAPPEPVAQPVLEEEVEEVEEVIVPADPKVAFQNAVATLKVSMVGGKQFVVSGTTLREGDTVTLRGTEGDFQAKIIKVSPQAILLEDVQNRNQATVSLGFMPSGMQAAGPGNMIPGMTPATTGQGQPAVLDIQAPQP